MYLCQTVAVYSEQDTVPHREPFRELLLYVVFVFILLNHFKRNVYIPLIGLFTGNSICRELLLYRLYGTVLVPFREPFNVCLQNCSNETGPKLFLGVDRLCLKATAEKYFIGNLL